MNNDLSSAFRTIYENNEWSNGSGPGSFASLNNDLFGYMSGVLEREGVRSIADVGCGDFQLFRDFDFASRSYLGLDVVEDLVAKNAKTYGKEGVLFQAMPESLANLPVADLYILKDVLIHLSNVESARLLVHILSKCRYAIIVNNTAVLPSDYNREVAIGGFRPVDVSLAPFNLPVLEKVQYGREWAYDPRFPKFLSILFRKRVWPGEKHIQLVAGRQ